MRLLLSGEHLIGYGQHIDVVDTEAKISPKERKKQENQQIKDIGKTLDDDSLLCGLYVVLRPLFIFLFDKQTKTTLFEANC